MRTVITNTPYPHDAEQKYNNFIFHIRALLVDCDYVGLTIGNFSPKLESYYNDDWYRRLPISNWGNALGSEGEYYYATTGFTDFDIDNSNVSNSESNTIIITKIIHDFPAEQLKLLYLGDSVKVGDDLYYKDIDQLDAYILKWVLK